MTDEPKNLYNGEPIYNPDIKPHEIPTEHSIKDFNFDNFIKVAQFWLGRMNKNRWAPDTSPDLWICNKDIDLNPYNDEEQEILKRIIETPSIQAEINDIFKDKEMWPGNQTYPVEYAVFGFLSVLAGTTKGARESLCNIDRDLIFKATEQIERIPTDLDIISKLQLSFDLDFVPDGTLNKLASMYWFGLQAYDKYRSYFDFFGGVMGKIKR